MLKKNVLGAAILASVMGMPALAGGHATVEGYALADGGKSLLVMADIKSGDAASAKALEKAVSAIAWRPVTGDLLGFANGHIYSIDPATGAMTDLGANCVLCGRQSGVLPRRFW